MSYYPQADSHITCKVKVLDLSNYATKKNQDILQVLIHLIQLLKKFIALKDEVDKLDINKLVNVPTGLNNLKSKVHELNVGELKIVLKDLKISTDIVKNEVVKNTKFNTLKMKVNKLDKKFLMQLF